MLLDGQRSALYSLSTVLNQEDLNEDSQQNNEDEHWVVEKVGKHIKLYKNISLKEIKITVFSNFSAVDFIEDLHKDESIEDKSVMETCIWGPKFVRSTELDTKKIWTAKEKNW